MSAEPASDPRRGYSPRALYWRFCRFVWFLRPIYDTIYSPAPIRLRMLFFQKVLGFNRKVPWPVHFTSRISGHEHITIGAGSAPGYMGGCYVFARPDSPIRIGENTIMANNVCIAGYSHDVHDHRKFVSKGGVVIGDFCWLGSNVSVMPGVVLGDHTVVAAGSVVTRSFPGGHCVIGGSPAKVLQTLDPDKVVKARDEVPYIGYRKAPARG